MVAGGTDGSRVGRERRRGGDCRGFGGPATDRDGYQPLAVGSRRRSGNGGGCRHMGEGTWAKAPSPRLTGRHPFELAPAERSRAWKRDARNEGRPPGGPAAPRWRGGVGRTPSRVPCDPEPFGAACSGCSRGANGWGRPEGALRHRPANATGERLAWRWKPAAGQGSRGGLGWGVAMRAQTPAPANRAGAEVEKPGRATSGVGP